MPTDNDEKKESELLYAKAKAYCQLSIPVHLTLTRIREDGQHAWCNGRIVEVKNDFFMLEENVDGLMPVFFLEVLNIEIYREKSRGKDERNENNP